MAWVIALAESFEPSVATRMFRYMTDLPCVRCAYSIRGDAGVTFRPADEPCDNRSDVHRYRRPESLLRTDRPRTGVADPLGRSQPCRVERIARRGNRRNACPHARGTSARRRHVMARGPFFRGALGGRRAPYLAEADRCM